MERLGRLASAASRFSESINVFRAGSRYLARRRFEFALKEIPFRDDQLVTESVILDGTWDNPNYWLRVQLLLSALGIRGEQIHGVLGPFRARQQAATMRGMGISVYHRMNDLGGQGCAGKAALLWEKLKCASEILEWELPFNMPPALLYDHILKRQRTATICIEDSDGPIYIREFLKSLEAANRVFQSECPGLFIASHAVGVISAWVWVALYHGIRVIVPYGKNGLCRYWSIQDPSSIFDFLGRPSQQSLESVPVNKQSDWEEIGSMEIARRLQGKTQDLGASCAYPNESARVGRNDICDRFNWDPSRRIVAFYASNWFDYPHTFGMECFTDHWDLIQTIMATAQRDEKINWLLKGHPCDDWYGSEKFREVMAGVETAHIRLADESWNGAELLSAVDSVVTCHGTVGVEAAVLGKSVLVADRGWYEDVGFVRKARDREHFIELLGSEWWKDLNLQATTLGACRFAGLFWGCPAWQSGFELTDDSKQWAIYETAPKLISSFSKVIAQEVVTIGDWFNSGQSNYHTFKMHQADIFLRKTE